MKSLFFLFFICSFFVVKNVAFSIADLESLDESILDRKDGFLLSSLDREKRQNKNRKCRGGAGFRCNSGQCIPKEQSCNGVINCPDSSDETAQLCKSKLCEEEFFKCAYGACIDKSRRCDGRKDCVDGSDEKNCATPAPTTCRQNEFKCARSGVCLKKGKLCNGKKDCPDGSDETAKRCRGKTCLETQFRCMYGACINGTKVCNGVNNCADGSDETDVACDSWNSLEEVDERGEEIEGCQLPPYPAHGTYTINGIPPKPGTRVSAHTVILYKCDVGHKIRPEKNSILYCQPEFTWNADPPACVVQCPKIDSTSMEITYSRDGLVLDPSEALIPTTIATLKCKHSYRAPPDDPNYRDVACLDTGLWSKPIFSCSPVCGTEIPQGQPLIINGKDVESGQFPWNVGIYRSSDGEDFQHICGGSIISPRLVVSAAHCFYDETTQQISTHQYGVGAGKFYRDWTPKLGLDPHAQLRKIQNTNIRLPKEYKGSRTSYRSDIAILILDANDAFMMSDLIRPVCIDWDLSSENQALQAGSFGKVAGWGKTQEDGEPSDTLKMLSLPFIPTFPDCFNSVPASFQPYLQEDKICAGYMNGSSVCEGDSGGGLMFRNAENKVWYIRGIVSIDPIKGNTCDSYSYSGYTKFSFHLQWMRSLYALIS